MKKKYIVIILLLISLCTFNIVCVKADSGFDFDYGSSSGSSHSSSSSSHSSSGHSSSSHSSSGSSSKHENTPYEGMDSKDDKVRMIFEFSIFITLILLLVALKFSRTGEKINRVNLDKSKELKDKDILKYMNFFDKDDFVKERYRDYMEIQNAWMSFDYEKIRSLVTDELYNQYKMQLDTLKAKNEYNKMSDFTFYNCIITDIYEENSQTAITIELLVSFYDWIECDKEVIRGSSKEKIKVRYKMTFVSFKNNNCLKCPNCGFEISNLSTNKCEYCGSIIVHKTDKWLLSKKEIIEQGFDI